MARVAAILDPVFADPPANEVSTARLARRPSLNSVRTSTSSSTHTPARRPLRRQPPPRRQADLRPAPRARRRAPRGRQHDPRVGRFAWCPVRTRRRRARAATGVAARPGTRPHARLAGGRRRDGRASGGRRRRHSGLLRRARRAAHRGPGDQPSRRPRRRARRLIRGRAEGTTPATSGPRPRRPGAGAISQPAPGRPLCDSPETRIAGPREAAHGVVGLVDPGGPGDRRARRGRSRGPDAPTKGWSHRGVPTT